MRSRQNHTEKHTKIYGLNRKSIGVDLANITNWLITFLFIKSFYNKDIRWWVAGKKTINMLAGTFKLAHYSLIKLKKYKGLVYNDEHEIAEINQILDTSKDIGKSNNSTQADISILNNTHKNYTFWGIVGSVVSLGI